MVMMPEYMVQQMADSKSVIPVGACMQAEGFDESPFLPRVLLAYQTTGVQWSMPFNVSDPVLYYNKSAFEQAGLDPDAPAAVARRAADDVASSSWPAAPLGTGIALDSGVDSGGGWFLEQWFARANELYADNGNGRLAPATKVLFDGADGRDAADRGAVAGAGRAGGHRRRQPERAGRAAQARRPGAAGGDGDRHVGGDRHRDQRARRRPDPRDHQCPARRRADARAGRRGVGDRRRRLAVHRRATRATPPAAAAWDFIKYLTTAQSQSTWASATGYVPIRQDALDLEPLTSTYVNDPRFKVPYDQLLAGRDDLSAVGPVHRSAAAGARRSPRAPSPSIFGGADVQASLTAAAQQSDALIGQYNALN